MHHPKALSGLPAIPAPGKEIVMKGKTYVLSKSSVRHGHITLNGGLLNVQRIHRGIPRKRLCKLGASELLCRGIIGDVTV